VSQLLDSTKMATRGSFCTRGFSFAQSPLMIQNAPSSQWYQTGRIVGPSVASEQVIGLARYASSSSVLMIRSDMSIIRPKVQS
jgi:hypothetical protein